MKCTNEKCIINCNEKNVKPRRFQSDTLTEIKLSKKLDTVTTDLYKYFPDSSQEYGHF